MIELIAAKGRLRSGIDLDMATDILLNFVGDDLYLAFLRDRGWTHDHASTTSARRCPSFCSRNRERRRGRHD